MAKCKYYDSPQFFLTTLMFLRSADSGPGGLARLPGCTSLASRTFFPTNTPIG
jgi:hypothetical protein